MQTVSLEIYLQELVYLQAEYIFPWLWYAAYKENPPLQRKKKKKERKKERKKEKKHRN